MIFLLTFTCYGSHLPGDSRGSFDHVRRGEPRNWLPAPGFVKFNRQRMRQEPFLLSDSTLRALVRDAILDVSRYRKWFLYALHVRTNHVHSVVHADAPASRALNDYKSYATRALRAAAMVEPERIVWTHGGTAHRIATPEGLKNAIRYVLEKQGEPMDVFSGSRR